MLRTRRANQAAGPQRRRKPRHGGTPHRAQWRTPFSENELSGRAKLLHEHEDHEKEPAEED